MEKPVRFTMVHKVTGKEKPFISYYSCPNISDVSEYVEKEQGVFKMEVVWDVYEDMRFKAKLRLWKYLTYFKQGKTEKKYNPYVGTEIGRSIPILH